MIELTQKQIAEYFHRSYTAVDGLWFMKIEEKYGFDVALDIDNEVWKVCPKIQARLLKSMGKLDTGTDALFEALTTKLKLEGFEFKTEKTDRGFRITINNCPWHNLMIKSKREVLSGKVGTLICNTEYRAWAAEFGENIKFELEEQICTGSRRCILEFVSAKTSED
jgi:predicted ArsR family transcriptional regulator